MALNARATQQFVPVKEVRDGVIILKDGGLRAVVLVSSINLSLKASDEQMAIISQFQTFLNSLDFSAEILIQSRRRDMRPYLLTLDQKMKEAVEPLLKLQIKEYIEFIRDFTDQVNIMTKNFFIIVPYTSPVLNAKDSLAGSFLGGNKNTQQGIDAAFEEKRSQLDQRISVIQGGLGGLGIRSVKLKTEEVIELLYKTFNPGDSGQGIKAEGVIDSTKQA